jgi:hypothetical protein
MSWLQKTPWLSLSIFMATYTVFGWSMARVAESWTSYLSKIGENWGWFIEEEAIFVSVHLLAIVVVILISFSLTIPIALVTFVFRESIGSNIKGLISILLCSLLFVFMISSLNYFADLLVMISAAILTRLDLLKLGCKNWQIFFIIFLLGSFACGLGIIIFRWQNHLI